MLPDGYTQFGGKWRSVAGGTTILRQTRAASSAGNENLQDRANTDSMCDDPARVRLKEANP
jgi:hypothetical protein